MKTKAYGAFIALTLTTAVACNEEKIQSPVASQGDEVNFGAELVSPQSRTYYGDPIAGENGTRVFPIYWNDLAKGYDKIFIYAPDAILDRNQAYYTVKPTEQNQTTPAAVVKNGEVGIQWADKPTDFYSFYPGNAEFNISAQGTEIKATMPGNQAVTYSEKLADAGVGVDKVFEAQPDMSCCMMVAKTPAVSPTTDAISLQFDPLSSVIDVTVNGPDETNTTTDGLLRVTSVSVTANGQICGEFTYDYSTGEVICDATATEADKTIVVSTMGEDADGDLVGVPLRTGQKLNVKLFVIPNPKVTDMTVSVITSDSQVWRKKLEMKNFQPRQIHPVNLPQLIAKEAQFDYRTWLSQLDPRIYISELSLPGSVLSFNTTDYVQGAEQLVITQNGNIDDQFNAGCRVFQGHFWMVERNSSIDNQPGSFQLTTSRGYETGVYLTDMLRELRAQMESVHSNGFCVILLSDYKISGSSYTFEDVYRRFSTVTDRMKELGILPESEIGPNTTIADVRGKIILKLQLNGSTEGSGYAYQRQNATLEKIQAWSHVNGAEVLLNWFTEAAQSNVFYSPMEFGSVGSFEFTPATAAWTNAGLADKASVTSHTPGLAYQAALKVIDTSKTGSSSVAGADPGNADCTTKPADMSSGMWYIYSEQANAGENYNTSINSITNIVNSINDTYDSATHNKFYMTYCGGTAIRSSYTTDGIAEDFGKRWLESVNSIDKKPYGWVLFNKVRDGATTKECIQKVISNNNDINFKLQRKKDAVVNKTRPTGDIQGANRGGMLF